MKKKYIQPYAVISRFSASDILLVSEDTFINDDSGWLMGAFKTSSAQTVASNGRFGSK